MVPSDLPSIAVRSLPEVGTIASPLPRTKPAKLLSALRAIAAEPLVLVKVYSSLILREPVVNSLAM